MPQHRSAEKRMKTSEKARQRNRAVKSRVRGAVKEFEAALDGEGREQAFLNVISELDRAAGGRDGPLSGRSGRLGLPRGDHPKALRGGFWRRARPRL